MKNLSPEKSSDFPKVRYLGSGEAEIWTHYVSGFRAGALNPSPVPFTPKYIVETPQGFYENQQDGLSALTEYPAW